MRQEVGGGWRFVLAAGLAAAGLCVPAGAGTFGDWQYRMKITFSGYNKSETLTNFPALVTLSTNISTFAYSGFASPATGADLRFAASNETDELNYEIEKWDTNGASYVWVQVPRLAAASDFIYAYWGKPGATAPAYTTNGATWGNGYVGVWHMREASGAQLKDSTTNANHSSANPFSSTPNGRVGNGMTASANYAVVPDSPSLDWTRITFEGWFKLPNVAVDYGLINKGLNGQIEFGGRVYYDGNYGVWVDNDGTWPVVAAASAGAQAGVWQHVAGVYDGANIHIYVNGVRTTGTAWSGTPLNAGGALYFGTYYDTTRKYTGDLDEIRISNLARSSNWIWACWANMSSTDTFLTFTDLTSRHRGTMIKCH